MKTPQDIQNLVNASLANLSPVTEKLMNAAKGSFQSVSWISNPKPAAAFKSVNLEKRVSTVCKAGIDFSNLGSVKTAIANGERGEVESLPWGEWEIFPFTIVHKGNRYVRLYPAAQGNQVKAEYFADGKPVSKSEFQAYLTPSDAAKMDSDERPACFTIKEENLIA